MGGGNHAAGPEGDYAFFGDGAWFAYSLAPVPRYAPTLARTVGKWLLSLVTNSRIFWPDQLPPTQQCASGAGGASQWRDPGNALPFEAARHCLYFRPQRRCLTGPGTGPIGTGDVCELLNCTDDPWKLGRNGTDRGLYGGTFTAVLGALVLATSQPGVPAFDVLSTDPWPAANPPSAALLLYNPLVAPLKVTVRTPAGTSLVGCYDVIDSTAKLRGGDGVIAKAVVADAQGRVGVTLTVKADWAALLEFRKCQTE
eukprot:COSAG01_NODE_6527_length_3621_cov_3.650767_1_plen_255_part_00